MNLAVPALQALTRLLGMALEKAALMQKKTIQNHELSEALTNLGQAHQSLINAGRLAALETVIYGLGHQLNNKIVPVMAYLKMLARNQNLPEDVTEKLTTINRAGQEISGVIEKLMRLSCTHESRNLGIHVNEQIHVALDLLRSQIQKTDVDLRLELSDSLPGLTGDPELFLQAVIAILHCSCMSFPKDQTVRRIRLSTSLHHEHVRIEVKDNGHDPSQFDNKDWLDPMVPLETIKDGSIFTYNIPRIVIRRHKGSILVKKLDQGGKRITVDLPLDQVTSVQTAI